MKILIASDSFKESMTSIEVADIIEKAFLEVNQDNTIIKIPISDGGEGFVEALIYKNNGKRVCITVMDALGRLKKSYYGLSEDKETAFIEMALVNGLEGISDNERNPLLTSTFGTGQLILDALDKGVKRIIIGLGGSATNDGGAGMANALGVRFLDRDGRELTVNGGSLARLHTIDDSNIDCRIKEVEVIIASDVDNILLGEDGTSKTYAKQKGADNQMILQLESNLENYANVLKYKYSKDFSVLKGSGAAGGLGMGLLVFTNAIIKSGIGIVLDKNHIIDKLKDVDLVVTGEGKIDSQTIYGKAPIGISKLAKKSDIKVIAFCGVTGEGYEAVYKYGIDEVYPIVSNTLSDDDVLKKGKANLYQEAIRVANEIFKKMTKTK